MLKKIQWLPFGSVPVKQKEGIKFFCYKWKKVVNENLYLWQNTMMISWICKIDKEKQLELKRKKRKKRGVNDKRRKIDKMTRRGINNERKRGE